MTANLDLQDRADLARFLREAIEADRYPLSPRVRRLKELLAKIEPGSAVSAKYLPLHIAEFQFRYNNRSNADIFGEAIRGC
jgi:hypothetical protein